MKRIFLPIILALAGSVLGAGAQTAPGTQELQEKIERLSGDVERLTQDNLTLRNNISKLSDEVAKAHEEAAKASSNTSVQEDLKHLADKIQEVDKKRIEDAQNIAAEIKKIGESVKESVRQPPKSSHPATSQSDKPDAPEKGYEYEVQSGDALSAIIAEYNKKFKAQGWKTITMQQVIKANHNLKPEKMKIGQKIFIPMPEK